MLKGPLGEITPGLAGFIFAALALLNVRMLKDIQVVDVA
jgi:hypothetical protein